MLGKNFLIYTSQFGTYEPIGCEESCVITFSAQEIITTTKGSGRSTNRELGRYDWQVTSQNVLFENGSVITAQNFVFPLLTNTKVIIRATLDGSHQGTFFGVGVVTNVEITGNAEGFITANLTIKADGPCYLPSDLQNTFDAPGYYEFTTTGTTTTLTVNELYNKVIGFVVVDDIVLSTTDYEFESQTGPNRGIFTFDPAITTGKLIQVYYQ